MYLHVCLKRIGCFYNKIIKVLLLKWLQHDKYSAMKYKMKYIESYIVIIFLRQIRLLQLMLENSTTFALISMMQLSSSDNINILAIISTN